MAATKKKSAEIPKGVKAKMAQKKAEAKKK
jgi:hypothetical protein